MKFITLIIVFFTTISMQAFAHTDHTLGEGSFHTLYHVAFWGILAIVIIKAAKWFKAKKQIKHSK